MAVIGHPRVHFRLTDSTNARARELAARGAPHGTLITAREQSAGRGRQGRTWVGPPGRALLASLVIREPPRLLPLRAGVAVAEVAGTGAGIKWPNDVHIGGRKVAGILVEGRPLEGWAVAGVGINVAVREADLPDDLHTRAGTLGLEPDQLEPTLDRLLAATERWLSAGDEELLARIRALDVLRERPVRWDGGEGIAAGIDGDGRLVVVAGDGSRRALEAGEVHLGSAE